MPMAIFTNGSIQGFKIDTTFQELEEDGSGINIRFTISRSPITQAFSAIIVLAMWCLGGGIFVAAIVCNSQPGIPSVTGTTSDMVEFFWNLLLVAVRCGLGYEVVNQDPYPKNPNPNPRKLVLPAVRVYGSITGLG
ncbi:hypothetical protein DFH08DRAFT_823370 [Mycena albidolilacea]|uniref:Uncharacterized protein n=1 Tax=Mycena albidolilacea TaxID=1033008 RepID=A0AAD7EC49_9AGAR|nr:hypothetical protein DFH08DRAFT_823370 [Mycena albidolilacea]